MRYSAASNIMKTTEGKLIQKYLDRTLKLLKIYDYNKGS